jgi:hypothetical protein
MSALNVTIDDREVRALLDTIDRRFRRRTINRGLRHAAKIVYQQARPNVPKKTGTLAGALKVRRLRSFGRKVAAIGVIIGKHWFRGETFYGAFVEWGHGIGKRSSGEVAAQRAARKAARMAPDVQAAVLRHERRRGFSRRSLVEAEARQRVAARLMLTNAVRVAGSFAVHAAVEIVRREVEAIRRGQGLYRGEEGSAVG